MKKETKMFLCGCAVMVAFFLFCSWSFNVGKNQVDIRTITEDGHKYVVATMTSTTNNGLGSVSIVHSEACSCKR